MQEIFNDGVMRATLIKDNWVWIEWLTNKVGYLSKTVVRDLHKIEGKIVLNSWMGWMLASEKENTNMHKLIERFGGKYQKDHEEYKIFSKVVQQ
jgi:hypothetical protein